MATLFHYFVFPFIFELILFYEKKQQPTFGKSGNSDKMPQILRWALSSGAHTGNNAHRSLPVPTLFHLFPFILD